MVFSLVLFCLDIIYTTNSKQQKYLFDLKKNDKDYNEFVLVIKLSGAQK